MARKRQLDNASHDAPSDPATHKRRRQYTEEDTKLAKIYHNLADEARDIRLQAAKELVLRLSPENAPAAQLANKILVRLIKGLCSGRKAARFGFFVALTEVLRQLYGPASTEILGLEPNIHGLVKLVAELTQPEGRASGQEKRDHLLGRVFGYKATIQSEILLQPNAPEECWANVLDQIYNLAREKPWLREECGLILCEAIKALDKQQSDRKLVQLVVDGLCSNGLAKTPEGVAVWLTVNSVFPDFELPHGTWHKHDPLCSKERQTLANVMKENFANASDNAAEHGKKVKSGTSQSTLNFSWDIVMATFLQNNAGKQSDFSKFWTDIVDNNLFSASSSPEQKSKGFQLFSRMLGSAPKWALHSLFSPNLMRCLINQRNDAERYLHNAAKAPLDEMRSRVKKTPDAAAPILEGLISRHGSLNFDQITKTKTVEGLLTQANGTAFEELLPLFKRLISRPEEEDEKAAESRRRTIADMLVSAVRSRNKENPIGSDSWLQQLLLLFTELAYFTPTASASPDDLPLPPVSEASRGVFQGRLSSCLAHLLAIKLDDDMVYPYTVVSTIRSKSKSTTSLSLTLQADKAILKTVKHAHKQLEEIASKETRAKEKKKPALRAFKLLFSLTILQVYNGDVEAIPILEELETCYDSAFQKGEKGANASQILTEVLLGFAAKPSVLFRKLSEQVFTTFASELTPEGLQSMIDILTKKESIAGQQDLFDQEASDVEEGESDDDDVEEASDVEMIDGVEEGDGDSQKEDEEDEDGSEGGEEDEEELAKFDALLAEALKTSVPKGNEGEEEDSESDMDDDQMMALESHLTKIFQERKKASGKKKENKDAKETMINFKNRVLDLLLIYVKQQYSNVLAMDLILPLLELIRSTTSKQIAEKSFNLLRQYFDGTKKGLPTPSEDMDVWALLGDVHKEVTKDASKLHAGACSRSSLFLAKVLITLDASNYDKLVDLYSQTQKQWYKDPKSLVRPSFFTEWVNWSIATKKQK